MGRVRFYLALAALGGAAFVVLSTVAQAQDAGTNLTDVRDQGVMERSRPGYDPVGIRAGSFMVFPTAAVEESYNDNIYATDGSETDDFITALSTGITANSVWGRHALSLSGGVSQLLYADNTDENRFNWNLGGAGRLDISRDTTLNASTRYAQLHEDRGDPNASTSLSQEPIEYNLFVGSADLNHRFNRITTRVGVSYRNYDYKDATSLTGATIDEDTRDRDEYTETARLGYSVSPDTNVYVEGRFDQRRYNQSAVSSKDSDGWAAVAGTEFKITRLTQGNVYAGYQERDYKGAGLGSTQGLAYGVDVKWFVTPLTTVTLSGDSRVEETTVASASGYDRNNLEFNVDHELLRNVILSGGASYTNDDFNEDPRNDDVTGAHVGVKYLLNRNFDVGLDYSFTNRDSNTAGYDYTRNVVGLTLTGKL